MKWLIEYSPKTKSSVRLGSNFIEKHVMIGWVEPEALVRILLTIFHDDRRFMDVMCTKEDLLNPNGMHPKTRSTHGLIRNIESGIMTRRDNVH